MFQLIDVNLPPTCYFSNFADCLFSNQRYIFSVKLTYRKGNKCNCIFLESKKLVIVMSFFYFENMILSMIVCLGKLYIHLVFNNYTRALPLGVSG